MRVTEIKNEEFSFYHEVNSLGENENIEEKSVKAFHYKTHSRSCYEILFVLDGVVSFVSEGIKYKLLKHDLLLVPPNTFYSIRAENEEADPLRIKSFLSSVSSVFSVWPYAR